MFVPILNQQVESGHKADDKNTFLVKVLKDYKAAMGGGEMALILHTGCPKTVPDGITKSRFELHYLFWIVFEIIPLLFWSNLKISQSLYQGQPVHLAGTICEQSLRCPLWFGSFCFLISFILGFAICVNRYIQDLSKRITNRMLLEAKNNLN